MDPKEISSALEAVAFTMASIKQAGRGDDIHGGPMPTGSPTPPVPLAVDSPLQSGLYGAAAGGAALGLTALARRRKMRDVLRMTLLGGGLGSIAGLGTSAVAGQRFAAPTDTNFGAIRRGLAQTGNDAMRTGRAFVNTPKGAIFASQITDEAR